MGRQGMDTLVREVADIREEFILEMPEMFLGLNSCPNSIKGRLGHPPDSLGDGAIVYGLEILSSSSNINLKLLPASAAVISFLSIDVEGFQVIYSPGTHDFAGPLTGGVKSKLRCFPSGVLDDMAMVGGKGIVVY